MVECCERAEELKSREENLLNLVPCPPPWKIHLLNERGLQNNVSEEVLLDVNQRCRRRRELLMHDGTVGEEGLVCVQGCRLATSAAVVVVVLVFILGILVWRTKCRKKRKLPRVKITNPVLDLKYKIELSVIPMGYDSVTSSDSGASNDGYQTTDIDNT